MVRRSDSHRLDRLAAALGAAGPITGVVRYDETRYTAEQALERLSRRGEIGGILLLPETPGETPEAWSQAVAEFAAEQARKAAKNLILNT